MVTIAAASEFLGNGAVEACRMEGSNTNCCYCYKSQLWVEACEMPGLQSKQYPCRVRPKDRRVKRVLKILIYTRFVPPDLLVVLLVLLGHHLLLTLFLALQPTPLGRGRSGCFSRARLDTYVHRLRDKSSGNLGVADGKPYQAVIVALGADVSLQ